MNLPPLPEPHTVTVLHDIPYYTADQMREYAKEYGEACRKQALEEAAVAAWDHYMDTCKKRGLPAATQDHWMACDAIRSLIK